MKTIKFLKIGILAVVLGSVMVSCSKMETEPQPVNNQIPDRATIIKTLKNLKFSFTEAGSGNFNYNSSTNSYSFVEPNTGNTYSQPTSGNSYNNVSATVSGNVSAGGGSFKLDGKTIELNYVACIAANNENIFGKAESGQSMLVGLSGNFDSENSKNSKVDYLIIAFVNDEKAKGSYDVIKKGASVNTDNFAFFSVFDLTKSKSFEDFANDSKLYFSTDGSMNFKGGDIELKNIKLNDDAGGEVSASGTLSCE